jgi:predicted RNase H-like HicB family nuclease
MIHIFPAVFQQETDSRFSIWFPDLPGCATSGHSLPEALSMARDALCGWLDCAIANNDTIPQASGVDDLAREPGQHATLIDVDLDAYRRSKEQRTVRRNVSLPAWMNDAAERLGLNVSAILQQALREQLSQS